jgi:hypothetical protein
LVFGDETELQVLKEPGRKAQAKSYIWAQMTDGSGKDGTGPPIRLFAYAPSRSTETAMKMYAGIGSGAVLMTDGYEPYDAVAEKHRLVHLACWAHCRRYFLEPRTTLQIPPPMDTQIPPGRTGEVWTGLDCFFNEVGQAKRVRPEASLGERWASRESRRDRPQARPVGGRLVHGGRELALR